MHWEAIGASGESLAAVAVVVSIVYLSIQIRSNTRATEASASFDATHSWALSNELVHQISDGLLLSFQRSYDPEAQPDEFSPTDRVRMSIHHRSLFQKLEGQYYLHMYGYLEPDVWRKRSS
jgi:hypothetical protein